MKLQENISLRDLTTIKLGTSKARYLVELTDADQLPEIYQLADDKQCAVYILGEGSNSIATDQDFDGIVVLNRLRGIEVLEQNDDHTTYKVASGEIWDDFVGITAEASLTGAEALSGIPGTVGGTPFQNVGAYGQEVSEILDEITVFDSHNRELTTLSKSQLKFAYRDSILKSQDKNRYVVTDVTYTLRPGQLERPFYFSLENYVTEHKLTDYSPVKIREYVKAVRDQRIPEYHQFPSAGSFFKNAEIPAEQFAKIKADYPDIPYGEEQPNGLVKIPTAWLIDKAGMKDQLLHGIRVPAHNPMILVNETATTHAQLLAAKQKIVSAIEDLFHITVEQEPIEIKA